MYIYICRDIYIYIICIYMYIYICIYRYQCFAFLYLVSEHHPLRCWREGVHWRRLVILAAVVIRFWVMFMRKTGLIRRCSEFCSGTSSPKHLALYKVSMVWSFILASLCRWQIFNYGHLNFDSLIQKSCGWWKFLRKSACMWRKSPFSSLNHSACGAGNQSWGRVINHHQSIKIWGVPCGQPNSWMVFVWEKTHLQMERGYPTTT